MNNIESVSEIFCKVTSPGQYSYGFTVSTKNGEFTNYIFQSKSHNDTELIEKIEKIRDQFIEKAKK